jgi:3-hydroxyacyl-CoA dehydrogenase
MGNGIAHTFAQSFTVKLIDVSENLWIKEWQQLPPI